MELLVGLIDSEPTASMERLWNQWKDAVLHDEDYLVPVLRHTFTNLYGALERDRRSKKPQRAKPSAAAVQERISALAKRATEIILFNLVLPNGKKLKDATFADCAKAGGWFAAISKKGKPHQIVGELLSEEQLRLMRAHPGR